MSIFATEEEKQSKKAMADAYIVMMQTAAWKDLEKFALDQIQSSMDTEDTKSSSDVTLGFVCEEKGYRKGIKRLIQHAKQRREGV